VTVPFLRTVRLFVQPKRADSRPRLKGVRQAAYKA
jgi:hypothetical protein